MIRKIIKIDDELCNGCGLCVPNCAEGAIQIIEGKARLISDLFCDGLGACLGHCPQNAIEIEEREAADYDEKQVMAQNIVKGGNPVIAAHLSHLKEHGEMGYYNQAVEYLKENGLKNPLDQISEPVKQHQGCPGSMARKFVQKQEVKETGAVSVSQLTHWPVQLHLIMPTSEHFKKSDLLIAADCTAFSAGNFHNDFLKGKTLVIACPKLDSAKESYVEKIKLLIDQAQVNTITVLMMQVPCCGGLLYLVEEARAKASRKVPVKKIIISLEGQVLSEDWI